MLKRKPADDHQGFAANKRGKSELVPSPLVFQREAQANDFDLAPEKAEKPHLQLPTVTSCVCHELCEKGNELLVVTNNKMFSEWNVPKNMASCSDNNELYLPAELQASIVTTQTVTAYIFVSTSLIFMSKAKVKTRKAWLRHFWHQ